MKTRQGMTSRVTGLRSALTSMRRIGDEPKVELRTKIHWNNWEASLRKKQVPGVGIEDV